MSLENIFENKELSNAFNNSLLNSEVPIPIDSFLTFKNLLNSNNIKIPKNGSYFLFGNYNNINENNIDLETAVEIRYYPKISEEVINKNNYEELKLTIEEFEKKKGLLINKYEFTIEDIISDHYGCEYIEEVGVASTDFLFSNSNLVVPNEFGYVLLRAPIFYVGSNKKSIRLTGFFGIKQNENQQYSSSIPMYNDNLLENLKKGNVIYEL